MKPGEYPTPMDKETGEAYWRRVTDIRLSAMEQEISRLPRMQRDLWIGVCAILVVLAWVKPEVWGVVMAWAANAAQLLHSYRRGG